MQFQKFFNEMSSSRQLRMSDSSRQETVSLNNKMHKLGEYVIKVDSLIDMLCLKSTSTIASLTTLLAQYKNDSMSTTSKYQMLL